MIYLQANSRPEMSMAVHQTARFCNNPMLSHEKAIKRLGRYLSNTRKEGIVYNPDKTKSLECYVDADFAGGMDQKDLDSVGYFTLFQHKTQTGYLSSAPGLFFPKFME